jgi:glycosyltransferase involved in cell wall biosynthesis
MSASDPGSNPLVSVVIPVYNCERYLAECISSVLAQTYRPLEIIVVDDDSTDNSAAVARSFAEVKYHRISHGGIGPARNLGIRASQGQLLSFLDADDLWPPEKTAWQVAAMAAGDSRDMIFGQVEQFRSPELSPLGGDEATFLAGPGYFAGAILIPKLQFLRVGYFSDALRVAEFLDWYARAQESGLRSHMLSEVVMKRRIHDSNTGIRERQSRGDYARALKAALNRRRAIQELGPQAN